MPRLDTMVSALEKKIDLTDFFAGEEAFVTIRKLDKYQFTLLLNRGRSGYNVKLYQLMIDWKEQNPEAVLTNAIFDSMKFSISPEETERLLKLEAENERDFFQLSILSDKHNFTDADDKVVEICADWFWEKFSGLKNSDGVTLGEYLVKQIIEFNQKGLTLGE
jgi:ABC-type nitrate/sulfonate/bicarbonate transport system substrate-binding protein